MLIASIPSPPPRTTPPSAQDGVGVDTARDQDTQDVDGARTRGSDADSSTAQGASPASKATGTKSADAALAKDKDKAATAPTGVDFAQALAASMNAQPPQPPKAPSVPQSDAAPVAPATLSAPAFPGLLAADAKEDVEKPEAHPSVAGLGQSSTAEVKPPADALATRNASPAQAPQIQPAISAQDQFKTAQVAQPDPGTVGDQGDQDVATPLSAAAGAAAQPTLQNGGVAKPAPLSTSATGRTPSISAKAGPGKSLGGASSVAQAGAATLDQVDTASIDAGVVGDRGQKDDAGDGAASSQSQPTGDAAAAPTGAPPDASALAGPLQAQAAAAAQSAAPKADVRTVSQLSAQIVQTVNGNKTSFDMTLHPEGLGDVQVKVSVDHNGAVTASMNFSDPHAAAELGARAGDLRDALAQAGFTVADNGLSFNLGGQGQPGSGQGGWSEGANPNGGRAFLAARDNSEDLLAAVSQAAARLQRPSAAGLDIRI